MHNDLVFRIQVTMQKELMLLVKVFEEELVAIDRREGLVVWPGGFKICFGIFDGILVLLLKIPKQNKHKNLIKMYSYCSVKVC